MRMLQSQLTYSLINCSSTSRRRCSRTCTQTAECTNARRIPPSQQNSLLAKPTRERHKRPAYGPILSVALSTSYLCTLFTLFTDTPTYTKFVLSQQNGTLHSWNSWTRGVRGSQRMLCTITNWMAKTRSRSVCLTVPSSSTSDADMNFTVPDHVCQEVEYIFFSLHTSGLCSFICVLFCNDSAPDSPLSSRGIMNPPRVHIVQGITKKLLYNIK